MPEGIELIGLLATRCFCVVQNQKGVADAMIEARKGALDTRPGILHVCSPRVYVIAGHKGQPEVLKSKGRQGRRRRLKGKAGRGTLEKERPPVFGMIQRGGQVVINLMANVQQKTIVPGTLVYTDEYSIYARLQCWGYGHKRVNHGRGECARDDDGDGLCEVHVNTMEGFWSLLRSWLRPHRGIAQEKLPFYLGFFEFVHNVRKRGKALLGALIELLVS